jgi:hypothetical protein
MTSKLCSSSFAPIGEVPCELPIAGGMAVSFWPILLKKAAVATQIDQ